MHEETLDFRREQQALTDHRIVKRLLSETIAHREQPAVSSIPDGERKHPAQALDAAGPVLLEEMEYDLRIGLGAKPVTSGDEFVAKRPIVVDFAVVRDPKRFVLIGQRLPAIGEVDDRETAMAERDTVIAVITVVVRTTMSQCRSHAFHMAPLLGPPASYHSTNAAHE